MSDKNTKRLRKAARRVAKATDEQLPKRLRQFGEAQTEWFNGLLRDAKMQPIDLGINYDDAGRGQQC